MRLPSYFYKLIKKNRKLQRRQDVFYNELFIKSSLYPRYIEDIDYFKNLYTKKIRTCIYISLQQMKPFMSIEKNDNEFVMSILS